MNVRQRAISTCIALFLIVGLFPCAAYASNTNLAVGEVQQQAGVSDPEPQSVQVQAKKKPSNAAKRKMKAAYKSIIKSASVSANASYTTYAIFDMGNDGYPELLVSDPSINYDGGFLVYDYHAGNARKLGTLYGTPAGTSKGALYASGGRQGSYWVKRIVKSGNSLKESSTKSFVASGWDDWDGALNRLKSYCSSNKINDLKTSSVKSYSLLNSKIKVSASSKSKAKAKKASKWVVKTEDYRFTIPKYWRGKVQWKTRKSSWQGKSGIWRNSYQTTVYLKGHKGDYNYQLAWVSSGGLTGLGTGSDLLTYKKTKRQDNPYINESVCVVATNWPYQIYQNFTSVPVKAQKKLLNLSTGNKVSYKAAKKNADYNTKNYKVVAKFLKPQFKKSLKVYL